MHKNLSSSKNHELINVIDGQINGIFFNEQTKKIIIDTDNGFNDYYNDKDFLQAVNITL